MKLLQEPFEKGVQITIVDKRVKKKSKSFTVYETTVEYLEKLIKEAIKKDMGFE